MNKETNNNQDFIVFRKHFGQHLQDMRKKTGLSQEGLAAKIGMDRVSIGYIEQGIRSPKLRTLFLISKVLSVDIQELLKLN